MSHLHNLLRDLVYVDPGAAQLGLSTEANSVLLQANLNSSGIVNQTEGVATINNGTYSATTNSNWWKAAGLLISPPVVDSTPYRVKAYVACFTGNAHIIVGRAPLAPTGSNDPITNVTGIPITAGSHNEVAVFDECILIPGVPESDPDFKKPVAFGIACSGSAGGIRFHLSVQNLAKTAPQFAASMS